MGSVKGAKKARQVREKNIKGKIQSAICIQQLYGEKVTVRNLAAQAQISTTTAAKYLREIRKDNPNIQSSGYNILSRLQIQTVDLLEKWLYNRAKNNSSNLNLGFQRENIWNN